MTFTFWYADVAFVWMSRKELNQAGRRVWVAQQLVNWFHHGNFLVIAIVARMIIWPRDRGRVLIISRLSRRVWILMRGVKEMRPTYTTQGTQP
jgi:hypothetical protein